LGVRSLYLKTKGKQPNVSLIASLLIAFSIIFIIDIYRQFIFGIDNTGHYLSPPESMMFQLASFADYFVSFVFCWFVYICINNEGFYKYFIEAPPPKIKIF